MFEITKQYSRFGYWFDTFWYGMWSCLFLITSFYVTTLPSHHVYLWLILITICAGWIIWSFLEYALHRFILHGSYGKIRKLHEFHHDLPSRLFGVSTVYSTLFFIGIVVLSLFFLGFVLGCALVSGIFLGYTWYGIIHFFMHHRTTITWIKRLKIAHAIHHMKNNCKFGVTTTFWDKIFQTIE